MGLTGDFAKLQSWAKFFEGLDKTSFEADVTREFSEFSLSTVRKSFGNSVDPYGVKWLPKKRPNGYKTLYGKKDKLNKFYISELSGNVFKIKTDAEYFWPHQKGAQGRGSRANWKLPQRQMLPQPGETTATLRAGFRSIYRKHLLLRARGF